MSVISNLLKEGKDLRIVQAFAGHKYPRCNGTVQTKRDRGAQTGYPKAASIEVKKETEKSNEIVIFTSKITEYGFAS